MEKDGPLDGRKYKDKNKGSRMSHQRNIFKTLI